MNRSVWKSRDRAHERAAETAARGPGRGHRQLSLSHPSRWVAVGAAFAIPVAMLAPAVSAQAVQPPVGNGFVVTAGDLSFILKQIKIAERHSATQTASNPCGTLVGPAADQIPDRLTAYGLRTVDGSCNNLFAGRETFAAADQPFPRLAAREVPRRRGQPARLLRTGQRHHPLQRRVHAEAGRQPRLRLRAADGQQPDRRPDLDQPGRDRRGRAPRCAASSNPGQFPVHHGPRPHRRHAGRSRRLRAVAPDPVHPERDHRRRAVPAVQLDVHLLRPVLRPRRRPDRQERRHRLRAAQGRRPADHRRPRRQGQHRRRGPSEPGLHGAHPRPEPARPGRQARHRR